MSGAKNTYNFYFNNNDGSIEENRNPSAGLEELEKEYNNSVEDNFCFLKPLKKSLVDEEGYLISVILTANEIDGEGDIYTEKAAKSIYGKLRKSFIDMKHGTNHKGNVVDAETESIWYTSEPSRIDGLEVPENSIVGKFFIRDEEVKKSYREGKKVGVSLESKKAKTVSFAEFKNRGYTYAGDQVGIVPLEKGMSTVNGKFTNSRFKEPRRVIIDAEIDKIDFVDLPMNLRVSIFKRYQEDLDSSDNKDVVDVSSVQKSLNESNNNEVNTTMENEKDGAADTNVESKTEFNQEELIKGLEGHLAALIKPLNEKFDALSTELEAVKAKNEEVQKGETAEEEPETSESENIQNALEKGFSAISDSLKEILSAQKTVVDEQEVKKGEESEDDKPNQVVVDEETLNKSLSSMIMRMANSVNQEAQSDNVEVEEGDSLSKSFKRMRKAGASFGELRGSRDSGYEV